MTRERARKIAELEKEKCELLGIIQGKDEVIANLKEQNKDLCESLDIMNNRESELLDMIEKMKCFGTNQEKWHKVSDRDYPPCERGNYSINVLTD